MHLIPLSDALRGLLDGYIEAHHLLRLQRDEITRLQAELAARLAVAVRRAGVETTAPAEAPVASS